MRHILAIDDEVIVTRVLARLLVNAIYKITVAISTLRRELPETRFIAISGGPSWGETDLLPRARELGAHYTFETPIDDEAWLEAREALLECRK